MNTFKLVLKSLVYGLGIGLSLLLISILGGYLLTEVLHMTKLGSISLLLGVYGIYSAVQYFYQKRLESRKASEGESKTYTGCC